MGAITIGVNLFVNGMLPGGADAALNGTASTAGGPVSLVAGDTLDLKIWFREPAADGGTSTVMTIPSGAVIIAAGKLAASAGEILFLADSFTADGDGYKAALDLNTVAALAAVSALAHGGYVAIYLDIEVQDAGNTERVTYRVAGRLYKQVYAGETAPAAVELPTPVLASPDGSRWQLSITNDGQLQAVKV